MPAYPADLIRLAAATPENEIEWRKGAYGDELAYVDARFVYDRLDASVGPANWQSMFERDPVKGNLRAGIGILVYDEKLSQAHWVWKWDSGDESDIESNKGEHSDSLKRAAVQWGIARDLYSLPPRKAKESSSGTGTRSTRSRASGAGKSATEGRSGGITDRQKKLLSAKAREAGLTGDKRRALLLFGVGKHSLDQLTQQDVDRLIRILDDTTHEEFPDVWANIDVIDGGKDDGGESGSA